MKKFKITRYDETITEPPYETIKIDEFVIVKPLNDHLGELFWDKIFRECIRKGYYPKFFTSCSDDENYDYEVVVF